MTAGQTPPLARRLAAEAVGSMLLANLMFDLPAVSISTHHRASGPHLLSEVVATAGLLLVIFALARPIRDDIDARVRALLADLVPADV